MKNIKRKINMHKFTCKHTGGAVEHIAGPTPPASQALQRRMRPGAPRRPLADPCATNHTAPRATLRPHGRQHRRARWRRAHESGGPRAHGGRASCTGTPLPHKGPTLRSRSRAPTAPDAQPAAQPAARDRGARARAATGAGGDCRPTRRAGRCAPPPGGPGSAGPSHAGSARARAAASGGRGGAQQTHGGGAHAWARSARVIAAARLRQRPCPMSAPP